MSERIGGAVLFCIGVYAAIAAVSLGLWEFGDPGPGLLPFAAGVSLAVLSALFVAQHVAAGRSRGAGVGSWRKLGVYVAALALYGVCLPLAGFFVTTLVASVLVMRAGERLAWSRALITASLAIAGAWLLFERLLGVTLPRGVLF